MSDSTKPKPKPCLLIGCPLTAAPGFAFCSAEHWAEYLGDHPEREDFLSGPLPRSERKED